MEDKKPKNLHFQRFEFKYLLPEDLADVLIPKLLKHMDWDIYVKDIPEKQYQVASLYYDNAGLACYYEKIAGVEKRKKLRLRVYDKDIKENTKVYIEIKRKDDCVVLKDRIIADHKDCIEAIFKGNYAKFKKARPVEEHNFLEEFFWTKEYNAFEPKVMVIYNRSPLIGKIDKKFRVTFDSNIRAYPSDCLNLCKDAVPVCPHEVIMEVKFNNILPVWFHEIIKDFELERISFSKYCMAIDACRIHRLMPN